MTRRDPATERQVQAAEPAASTWLSANAGSGKTRVLTDRVARLLLSDVQPQRILCLTYTKAAASEMQNRLFRTLGSWAMKPDAELRQALAALGEEARLSAADLAAARRLFARAIETPGGLRIQTIHSFCATLLRRFPLEAEVSPRFTEMDDRAARLLRDEIAQELSDRIAPQVMADLARAYTGEDFAVLLQQVAGNRGKFDPPLSEAQVRALFGVPEGEDMAQILAQTFVGDETVWMAHLLPVLRAGLPTDFNLANALDAQNWLSPDLETLAASEDLFLTKGGAAQPFSAKIDALPTKNTRLKLGADLDPLNALMARVESARHRRIALEAADRTATLHRFAAAFLPIYAARKAARGWLDFDDLITRAKALLTDPSVAAWVLFRLDGGIDHILVDEAQDTSPDQWRVIELLTGEFTAGIGTRPGGRTLFVVGDKKQSIYSFQGADVAAFDEKHRSFGDRFRAAGQQFQSLDLTYSFRSSPAVLRLVDATLHQRFSGAVGADVQHIAHKDRMPGRVDLWPLIEPVKEDPDENWETPVDRISQTHHNTQLARQIADEIRAMIDTGVQIPVDASDHPAGYRPVHEGDFLILVQRRSALFSDIIRECKVRKLAVAGADRLKLGAEMAVKDLTALLSFLATPEDDLALAVTLRSPLCGWSEARLYDLAQGRVGFLWQALRQSGQPVLAMLDDLRRQADYLRPYEVLERCLTRHDGRRRLLTRLGDEAMEGIDALLAQALAYEQSDVPSLTGFLVWLDADEVDIKRQMEAEGRRIRVMTVHGAKGLEAPIVIVPDTTDRSYNDRDEVYAPPAFAPVWRTGADNSPPLITAERDRREVLRHEESLRLLYVALTRARCWLIVAGAGEGKVEVGSGAKKTPKPPITWCWYRQVQEGMRAAGALPNGAERWRLSTGDWPEAVGVVAQRAVAEVALPDWASLPAPGAARPALLVSPSALGGAKVMPGEADPELEAAALARGTALHLLLEHLPGRDAALWSVIATSLIPDPLLCQSVLVEAVRVLTAPDFAALFSPDALTEVAVTGDLAGRRLYGSIDRLLIDKTRVLAIDFKSNRLVPPTQGQVPEGVLRQMGAYAHLLAAIYPGHRIETALLWTGGPSLMQLDPDIVRLALSRATIP